MTALQKKFLRLGEAFLTPYEERSEDDKVLTNLGICHGLLCLNTPLMNPVATAARFYRPGYWLSTRLLSWGKHSENDHVRGLFCLLMAHLRKKDFEELWISEP